MTATETPPIYLMDTSTGAPVMYKVEKANPFPVDAIIGTVEVHPPKAFRYDGRSFTHTVYAQKGKLVHVIGGEYMKWTLPLDYLPEKDYYRVGEKGARPLYEVYMKDINYVIVTGPEAVANHNVIISDNHMKSVQLTNVYNQGRTCFSTMISPITPPETILSMMEASESNDHVMERENGGIRPGTNELMCISLHTEGDRVIATPSLINEINHEYRPFLQHLT
mgnify:CR=1 FL=1|tara:strand:+ start:2558 stop:3223 length:666 start_codon:yes stop_codon:yes gene_type:complete